MRRKRLFDLVVSVALLVVVSPVIAVLGVLVWVEDRGPIFYRGRRVGLDGTEFAMLKLRSMSVDADRRGPSITATEDPRVTRVGALLRRARLDELPQIWNVLCGDMSLVGPRPEAPDLFARYTPRQREIVRVRPGVTGPGQLAYAKELEAAMPADVDPVEWYFDVMLPPKIELDLAYARSPSLRTDIEVLVSTARHVVDSLSGRGPESID